MAKVILLTHISHKNTFVALHVSIALCQVTQVIALFYDLQWNDFLVSVLNNKKTRLLLKIEFWCEYEYEKTQHIKISCGIGKQL